MKERDRCKYAESGKMYFVGVNCYMFVLTVESMVNLSSEYVGKCHGERVTKKERERERESL